MTRCIAVDGIQYPRVVNDFSRVEKLSADKWEFYWFLNKGDRAFDGHYPHQPVFPGVFVVEMALIAAGYTLRMNGAKAGSPLRIDSFRFYHGLLPGDQCVMRVSWQDPGSGQETEPGTTDSVCLVELLSVEGGEKVNRRVAKGRLCMRVAAGGPGGKANAD